MADMTQHEREARIVLGLTGYVQHGTKVQYIGEYRASSDSAWQQGQFVPQENAEQAIIMLKARLKGHGVKPYDVRAVRVTIKTFVLTEIVE